MESEWILMLDDIIQHHPHFYWIAVTIKIKTNDPNFPSRARNYSQSNYKLGFPDTKKVIKHLPFLSSHLLSSWLLMIYSCSYFAIKMMNCFSLLIIKKRRCWNMFIVSSSLDSSSSLSSEMETLKWQFIRWKQKLLKELGVNTFF